MAQDAVTHRQAWLQSGFSPECLTIYLSTACNLSCAYCYSRPTRHTSLPPIDPQHVEAGACIVARSCVEKGRPFQLLLHGGGEPTVHWPLVPELYTITRRIAHEHGLDWVGHIATNGVLSETRARWLGQHFSSVGLSWDGPPDIQDQQRHAPDGRSSSATVARTARALLDTDAILEIRTTITPATVCRQEEVVAFFLRRVGTCRVRFEPVYRQQGNLGFSPEMAQQFVHHFLAAQSRARAAGMSLEYSGMRPDEVHGPFCEVHRQVLHLTPDGEISGCFFCIGQGDADEKIARVGRFDPTSDQVVLDHAAIARHRLCTGKIPDACRDCPVSFHCARGCPEECELQRAEQDTLPRHQGNAAAFRCQVHRGLFEAWVEREAQLLIQESNRQLLVVDPNPARDLEERLAKLPGRISREALRRAYSALHPKYRVRHDRRMPRPVWQQRGFEHLHAESWKQLQMASVGSTGPVSVYLHIPFCAHRCGFCDCYSFRLKRRKDDVEAEYVAALVREIEAWAKLPHISNRMVTTVHFGGGTPDLLSANRLARLVETLHNNLRTGDQTEWALETTASQLNSENLNHLRGLGFNRLHVGVQTLAETLRRQIGRILPATRVLERLERAAEFGFVATVDLIYGLPGQGAEDLVGTLDQLLAGPTQGISLYRLNRSRRNQRFVESLPNSTPDPLLDFVLLQSTEQLLCSARLCKRHFSHFAKPADRNLYFTHPQRGEDLIALGASADGVIGDQHYRHPGLARYLAEGKHDRPALEGSLSATAPEKRLRSLVAQLVGGCCDRRTFAANNLAHFFDAWKTHGLLYDSGDLTTAELSASGTWFISDMLSEISREGEEDGF